jgi:7-cyano-7-deazaguanine synthase
MPKAVVLLSGGLDSATTLALAMEQGFTCYALSLDYGQRHNAELAAAKRIAQAAGVADHKIIRLNLDEIGGSALTDPAIAVPQQPGEGIPVFRLPGLPPGVHRGLPASRRTGDPGRGGRGQLQYPCPPDRPR